MKRLFYLIIAVIYSLSFYGCGGGDQKPASDTAVKTGDTTIKKPNPAAQKIDTTPYRHLAFLDDATLKKVKSQVQFFSKFLARFTPVPQADFDTYYTNFNTALNNGSDAAAIQNFVPPAFSIYEKYNDFQNYLGLQSTGYTDIVTQIIYNNKIRIYPAIDPGKQFYLVFIAEKKDVSSITNPDPTSDLSVFYSMKGNVFDMIPKGNPMSQAIIDIKNFQTIWKSLGSSYYELRSFSYSIAEYDELLSSTPPFWDVASEKTNSSSKKYVRIFPVIDNSDPTKILFRLVFKLYQKNILGNYVAITSKPFLDNMDPCPTVCPDATTEIK